LRDRERKRIREREETLIERGRETGAESGRSPEKTQPEAELPVELEDPTDPDPIFGEQWRDFRWIVGRLS
jgi:hypothetical protein